MIPATKKKLREAQFFLAQLERDQLVPVWKANPEHAEFHFSALVSAGRSVTFTLQAERKVEYDAWFPGWLANCSASEQLVMKRFNEARNDVVKRVGADLVSRNVLASHDDVFPPTGNVSAAYIMNRINHPSEARVGTVQLVCRFGYDDSESIAVDAGREYVATLVRLVGDFATVLRGAT
jgi:hypothetical protein